MKLEYKVLMEGHVNTLITGLLCSPLAVRMVHHPAYKAMDIPKDPRYGRRDSQLGMSLFTNLQIITCLDQQTRT